MSEIRQQAERARRAFLKLSTGAERTRILLEIAQAIRARSSEVFEANAKDLAAAKNTLAAPLYKRLVFNESKLRDVVDGIEQIAAMQDPVGRVVEETELDDGLLLRKVQTPIGVIAAVFESRPDVVPQIASLAIRSGNAVLMKGGSEAAFTNAALGAIIRDVLVNHDLADAVQLLSTREEVTELLAMDDLIGLVVPRGSNEMVRSIQQRTKIPVLGHADGICHVFIDESADVEKAIKIAVDSKAQYPAVCNAAETLLIHREFKGRERVLQGLRDAGVELRMEQDFGHEFLDLIMAVRIVENIGEAIDHIHRYGSGHTDAIVTEDPVSANRFLNEVDSAGVYWNASTRFADGFRYGFGAEVGVSTNKTHARGPVGVDGLLIYKYHLIGNGHVVSTYTGANARPFTHRRRPGNRGPGTLDQ
jgi:glutamate-5-semialdehyde dehydrogenase